MTIEDNVILNLVEPQILEYRIGDRPDLGCAMLIAACQKENIKIKLIKGQTRYIRDMFLNDGNEICELIHNLNGKALEKLRLHDYKRDIQRRGKSWFKQELQDTYRKVFINKEPRNFLNAELLNRFQVLYSRLVTLYRYYICELHYYNLSFFKRYISEILKNNPRYIGFSLANYFDPTSRAIRKHIKKLTSLPIIVGGNFTPFIKDDNLDAIFSKEYIDYLIIGAGEHALPSLIETLDHKKEPAGIANVFYKKGSFVKTNSLKAIINLDKLPFPDFSQFDLDLYLNPRKVLPLQDARGCSWRKCTFCDYHRKYFNIYSTFSIDRIIETIQYLKDTYNCQYFLLHNDDLPPIRARKISNAIIKYKIKNIFIQTYARLVDGFNDDLLCLMGKAGFRNIIWGLESGSQRVLELMNKGIKIHTASRILRSSKRNKIANTCAVIFNFPGESLEEVQETINFLKKHARYNAVVSYQQFTLSPWAQIYKDFNKWRKKYQKESIRKEELQMVLKRLDIECKLGITKISSNSKYKNSLWHFFLSSWGHLSEKDIIIYLYNKKFTQLFPLILGEVKHINDKAIFCPINIRETNLINQIIHPKAMVLDKIEEKIFFLSDGYNSIYEILTELNNLFSEEYGNGYILNKCINFFEKIHKMDLLLGFKRSLRT